MEVRYQGQWTSHSPRRMFRSTMVPIFSMTDGLPEKPALFGGFCFQSLLPLKANIGPAPAMYQREVRTAGGLISRVNHFPVLNDRDSRRTRRRYPRSRILQARTLLAAVGSSIRSGHCIPAASTTWAVALTSARGTPGGKPLAAMRQRPAQACFHISLHCPEDIHSTDDNQRPAVPDHLGKPVFIPSMDAVPVQDDQNGLRRAQVDADPVAVAFISDEAY